MINRSALPAALAAAALILASVWIIRPFLAAFVLAVTIVVSTWPLLLRIQAVLWRSRALAVGITTLIALLVFMIPFWLAVTTLVAHRDEVPRLVLAASAFRIPQPPRWLSRIPAVGPHIVTTWQQARDAGIPELASRIRPYAGQVAHWSFCFVGSFGGMAVRLLLTLIMTAMLHAKGEAAAELAMQVGGSLAGRQGRNLVDLAGRAIRAVAIGVVVTAVVEAVIAFVGLRCTGVPFALILAAMTFVVCLLQAGPGVILIPAVLWMYVFRDGGLATLLLVVTIVAIVIDNLLRPFLIRREADVPMLLVIVGVVGGVAGFGLVGIIVGPVLLAVSSAMLTAWMGAKPYQPLPPAKSH
ncbi:AI-2E family transporter (plasmid) [Lichenicola cladoniae]|uniref:AI-2E family transporter n=1 Tax=Lichenicola cladoniae TaxID=1484109 RepID=A0A6M8HYA3_9PROT|nr:AI-2E family transporter [Lichenicola cladoniae]NPD70022.1 AI-2E family transporter [Acetobacteraceae bacterium]QKE93554.1 AI-2E family transporter [Lichenicola cladoniae]